MEVPGIQTVIVSIFVLYLGIFLVNKIPFLKKYNIPAPVVGGLLCSIGIFFIGYYWETKIQFDLEVRDFFLLVFFSTVGLSARAKLLAQGGKTLGVLLLLTVVFLLVQNFTGIFGAYLVGINPAYGLFGGTISLAGGHGTAITWGNLAQEYGFSGVTEFGLAAATFGLIFGGMIGGPIAQNLINKFRLSGNPEEESFTPGAVEDHKTAPVTAEGMIDAILMVSICLAAGLGIHELLEDAGAVLPSFLPAMFVGILLTNLLDLFKIRVQANAVSLFSDVSLQIFLAISLMSMQLAALVGSFGPILIILTLQVIAMGLFARFLVFRAAGKDYDAAVMSAGFAGLGLGATPVGIANMRAVTKKYGPSQKAFFIIPLIGAFFLDIVNAFVIKTFLKLPIFS